MGVPRRAAAVLLGVAASLSVSLTGCGVLGMGEPDTPPSPTEDVAQKARERVQGYLDAMRDKDLAVGREALCEPLRAGFDASATGPNGDFAAHFTVTAVTVTEVRPDGRRQQVAATVTVKAGKRATPVDLLFTVARSDGAWCIAEERQGDGVGSAAPTPGPS